MNARIESAQLSDVGLMRSNNEDSTLASPERGLFAVADGVGGHAGGEIASAAVVELLQSLPEPVDGMETDWMFQALTLANDLLLVRGSEDEALANMASTCTCLYLGRKIACLGHVGDSRAYLWRGGKMRLVTLDHTLVQDLIAYHLLSPEHASMHPDRGQLTRALGRVGCVPDCFVFEWHPGDNCILCTDGLYGVVPDHDIAWWLSQTQMSPADVCGGLVEYANSMGGPDNISVVLVRDTREPLPDETDCVVEFVNEFGVRQKAVWYSAEERAVAPAEEPPFNARVRTTAKALRDALKRLIGDR